MRLIILSLCLLFVPWDAQAQSMCSDGWASGSSGSGTCSHHGGIADLPVFVPVPLVPHPTYVPTAAQTPPPPSRTTQAPTQGCMNGSDSDCDGLSDNYEINSTHTNPFSSDTDSDGLKDNLELWNFPAHQCNNWVYCSGGYQTSGVVPDSDGDGLLDGVEVLSKGTNPSVVDTDGDGLPDGTDADPFVKSGVHTAPPPVVENPVPPPHDIPAVPETHGDMLLQRAIKDMLNARLPRLQQCYDMALTYADYLHGSWRLTFRIGQDGSVVDIEAQGQTMHDSTFESCVVSEMSSWAIVTPVKGDVGLVAVTQSFGSED